jgi:hypothetical protein
VPAWKHENTKWKAAHSSDVTRVPYDEMYARVRERLPRLVEQYGSVAAVITDHSLELLSFDDFAAIDGKVLAAIGRKYQAGAEISALEEPERYTI